MPHAMTEDHAKDEAEAECRRLCALADAHERARSKPAAKREPAKPAAESVKPLPRLARSVR
jgi:hypothetical protein